MRNIIKFQTALPLTKNILRWPHLPRWEVTLGAKGWRHPWRPYHHQAAAVHQSRVMSCQSGATWQGQAQLKLCSILFASSKSPNQAFFSLFRRKLKTAQEFQKADNVDSHYELIYSIRDGVKFVKLGIGGLDIVAASVIANICMFAFGVPLAYLDLVLASPVESGIFVMVNSLICFQLFKVIRWYPLRIYYSELEDQFLAVFIGVHPFAIRPLKIEPGEVKPLEMMTGNVLPWASDLYATSSQRIFLFTHNFRYPLYYNKLLGYI